MPDSRRQIPDARFQTPDARRQNIVFEGRGVLHPPLPSDTHRGLQVGAGATHPYLQQHNFHKLNKLYNLIKQITFLPLGWLAEKTPSNGSRL